MASSTNPDNNAALIQYADALASDPVQGTWDIVATCRASGQWRAELQTVLISGNKSKLWDLHALQLLRDCDTRWLSTKNMITRLIYLYAISVNPWYWNICWRESVAYPAFLVTAYLFITYALSVQRGSVASPSSHSPYTWDSKSGSRASFSRENTNSVHGSTCIWVACCILDRTQEGHPRTVPLYWFWNFKDHGICCKGTMKSCLCTGNE